MSKKNKNISRDFTAEDIATLSQTVNDDRFKFTEEDFDAIQNPDTPKSSDSYWKAENALKKVRKLKKATMKNHALQQRLNNQAAKAPITRQEALRTFVRLKEGQELGASMQTLLDILIKNKLTTQKEFDRLWQEKVLDGRQQDPCPHCYSYSEEKKKCKVTAYREEPTLAKTMYPDLKGAKAKRVIQCLHFKHKETNTDANLVKEPKDEKGNDNKEGTTDNG